MAEGAQPQQPPQLGPGAAARGMKRESELELPVPGAGGDGAEPGLSKRPRTEEAAADGGGGMQVTARDGRRWPRGRPGAPGLEGRASRGPGWAVGGAGRGLVGRWGAPAWRRRVREPLCAHEGPDSRGDEGARRVTRFWGEIEHG